MVVAAMLEGFSQIHADAVALADPCDDLLRPEAGLPLLHDKNWWLVYGRDSSSCTVITA